MKTIEIYGTNRMKVYRDLHSSVTNLRQLSTFCHCCFFIESLIIHTPLSLFIIVSQMCITKKENFYHPRTFFTIADMSSRYFEEVFESLPAYFYWIVGFLCIIFWRIPCIFLGGKPFTRYFICKSSPSLYIVFLYKSV